MSDSIDYTSLFRLDGRKVVVVGGGSGLGRAASIALAQYGANLVVADVNIEGLKDTVAEIEVAWLPPRIRRTRRHRHRIRRRAGGRTSRYRGSGGHTRDQRAQAGTQHH